MWSVKPLSFQVQVWDGSELIAQIDTNMSSRSLVLRVNRTPDHWMTICLGLEEKPEPVHVPTSMSVTVSTSNWQPI